MGREEREEGGIGNVTSGMYLHENRTAFLHRNGCSSSYKGLVAWGGFIQSVLKVKLLF